jgi:ATP-dependent Clp protease ATP-binding subunit ClpA
MAKARGVSSSKPMVWELTRRIDLARIDARRRRHDSTEPEHLLAVALESQDIAQAVRARGLDPVELRDRLESRFTTRPAVGGYRDGSDSPLSTSLTRVVGRLKERRWVPFIAKMTILDALLLEPSIAELVFELRRGNDYRYVVERARARAVLSRHDGVGVEHVFSALLDVRSFVDTVRRAEGDADRLRATVDGVLDTERPKSDLRRAPPIDPAVQRMISARDVTALPSGTTVATIRMLCLQLARQDESERFWTAAGIHGSDFVRAVHLP